MNTVIDLLPRSLYHTPYRSFAFDTRCLSITTRKLPKVSLQFQNLVTEANVNADEGIFFQNEENEF